MPSHWNPETLKAARAIGDPPIDDGFMPDLFGRGQDGQEPTAAGERNYDVRRLGFNLVMDIASRLLAYPELAITNGSELKRLMEALPAAFVDYYDPIEAPAWVDEKKLALASQVWHANSLPMLIGLAAASLPSCYMIEQAVPTLYDTRKLSERRYLYQRIFETGIFVNDVLSAGGLKVFKDFDGEGDKVWGIALNEADPDGKWKVRGGKLVRTAGPGGAVDQKAIAARAQRLIADRRLKRRRYIWGPGYIAARKVRFLHATMRYMLMNPGAVRPHQPAQEGQKFSSPREAHQHATVPFDVQKNGVPINQEDTAYTLMTFSLVLYRAIEYAGRTVSPEEKVAVLHQWKVIGHIMGVEERFLTDDPQEAEELFLMVQARHAGATEVGYVLTDSILDWLGSMLPPILGARRHIPTLLCEGLLGPKLAPYVVRPQRSQPPLGQGKVEMLFWRPAFAVGIRIIRVGYWISDRILARFQTFKNQVETLLHGASVELIHSFRDGWARKTFWLPSGDNTWHRRRGADQDFEDKLHAWRCKLANTVFLGVGFLTAGKFALLAFLYFLLADWAIHIARPVGNLAEWANEPVAWSLALTAAFLGGFAWMLMERLPKVVKQRPTLRAERAAAKDGDAG